MRKGHNIIGLTVLAADDGAELGTVRDLIFDHDADQCAALLLDEGGFFSAAEVVCWEEIKALGPDAVMVRSKSSRTSVDHVPRLKALIDHETVLSGTRIYTTTGEDLGTFGDVYVDEATGKVMGYEVSGGFVSDTMSGKRYLAAQHSVQVGEDVVIMPPSAATILAEQAANQPGGLKGMANTAGDKIEGAYDTAREKAGEAYDTTKEKAGVAYDNVADATESGREKLSHAAAAAGDRLAHAGASLEQRAEDAAIGQTAGREVLLPSGSTLVAPGQTISQAMFDEAERHGKRAELIAAAGLGAASEGASHTASQVEQKASGLWETVKEKTNRLVDAAEDKIDELDDAKTKRKIHSALGRPVTKVILAKDDSVILNTGNIITHASIEHARAEGMLDTLLDSVSSAEPPITAEMLRADTPGEDALPHEQESSSMK